MSASLRIALVSGLVVVLLAAPTGAQTSPAASSQFATQPSAQASEQPAAGGNSGKVPPPPSTQRSVNEVTGYVTPDAPALALLGATTSEIDRPSSAQELGVALANVVTPQGTVRSGIAVEVSLRALGYGSTLNNYQYRHRWGARFLSRMAFSLATTADVNATAMAPATHLAVGARFVFIDESDPLLDPRYYRSAPVLIDRTCGTQRAALNQCRDTSPDATCENEQEAYGQCMARVSTEYYDKHRPRWNYGGLSLSVAQGFALNAPAGMGPVDNFRAWLTGALGLGQWGQLAGATIFQARWDTGESTVPIALRLRAGGTTTRVTAEGVLNLNNVARSSFVVSGRLSVGGEVRLSDNLWATASFGGDITNSTTSATFFVLSNLKWAMLPNASW